MPASAGQVTAWIEAFAAAVAEHKVALTDLDRAIGDGDHGINMDRGMRAVVQKLSDSSADDVGGVLRTVGMTLLSKVGGASGPLYGTFFLEMGKVLAGVTSLDAGSWVEAMDRGARGVQARGKAEQGDKTMLDAMIPAVKALAEAAGEGAADLGTALAAAADAAEKGRDATEPLVAHKGRASYLGERSAGHVDPGATSTALLFRTAATTFSSPASPGTPGEQG